MDQQLLTFSLRGVSKLYGGAYYAPMFPRLENESKEDWEGRTWRNRFRSKKDTGEIYLTGEMIKETLIFACKWVGETIPQKGKSTYTKYFRTALFPHGDIFTGIKLDEVEGDWDYVQAQGGGTSTTRVMRCFPYIDAGYVLEGQMLLFDNADLKPEIVHRYLSIAGNISGIGVRRPSSPKAPGPHGRFQVISFRADPYDIDSE